MTYIEHLDDKFDFGKFSGCTFAEVVEFNPEYISWVVENVSGAMCVFCDSAIEELRLIFPRFEISYSFEAMRNLRIAEFEDLEDENYEESMIMAFMMIPNLLRMDDMQGHMHKMKWDIAMMTSIRSLMVTLMRIGTLTNFTLLDCSGGRCERP